MGEKPWVKAYFSGLNMDPNEAMIIFTLMDTDASKELSMEEFVEGIMKLKGHAKSIDVLSLMFDNVRFMHKFNKLCSFVEDEITEIKKALIPDKDVAKPTVFSTIQEDRGSPSGAPYLG